MQILVLWFIFTLWFFSLLSELPNLHLLPALYSYVCLFFLYLSMKIIIFYVLMTADCLRRCKFVVKQGKNTKNQHLVTPAMLPPHGFSIFFMTSYEVSESSLRPTEAVSYRRVVPYKAVVWKRNDELRRSPSCHLLFFHVVLLPKKFTEHKWGRVEDQHTLLTEVWSTFSPPIHHFRLQVHFEDLAVCKKQKQKKKNLHVNT